jgi:hypothetical protein
MNHVKLPESQYPIAGIMKLLKDNGLDLMEGSNPFAPKPRSRTRGKGRSGGQPQRMRAAC